MQELVDEGADKQKGLTPKGLQELGFMSRDWGLGLRFDTVPPCIKQDPRIAVVTNSFGFDCYGDATVEFSILLFLEAHG